MFSEFILRVLRNKIGGLDFTYHEPDPIGLAKLDVEAAVADEVDVDHRVEDSVVDGIVHVTVEVVVFPSSLKG